MGTTGSGSDQRLLWGRKNCHQTQAPVEKHRVARLSRLSSSPSVFVFHIVCFLSVLVSSDARSAQFTQELWGKRHQRERHNSTTTQHNKHAAEGDYHTTQMRGKELHSSEAQVLQQQTSYKHTHPPRRGGSGVINTLVLRFLHRQTSVTKTDYRKQLSLKLSRCLVRKLSFCFSCIINHIFTDQLRPERVLVTSCPQHQLHFCLRH